jgi:hypothetical protein
MIMLNCKIIKFVIYSNEVPIQFLSTLLKQNNSSPASQLHATIPGLFNVPEIVIFRSKFRLNSDDDASKTWIRCTQNMDQVRPKYGSGAPKIWIRCAQNMDQVRPKYGSGAPKIWIRCTQNMDQVHPKYGSGAPKIA